LERHLALQRHHATGNAGLSLGDGEFPRCQVKPNGEIRELCFFAHAQCPMCDRYSDLPIELGNDRGRMRACGRTRPKSLE
jgi:hypothetical protein